MEKIIYNVLEKLEKNGYEAFVVGGFVRDKILGKKSYDVDITTSAIPKDIISIFNEYNPRSSEYGNVLFELGSYYFEITTYRKEYSYVKNRKPDRIEYIDDLDDDLKRRDFTINTICMDKNGKIIDKLNGKPDIKNGIIRSVGNPHSKVKEDSLRILRAIRFATILNFKIDDELKSAIKENRGLLKELSYTRKKEELTRILTHTNKKYAVELINELELSEPLEVPAIDNALKTNILIGIWASITSADYAFTKTEKDEIKKVHELYNLDIYDRLNMYKYGAFTLSIVSDLLGLNTKKIIGMYDKLPIKDRSEIKIKPEEICSILKKDPDAFIKEIYSDLEHEILYNKLKNKNNILKKYVTNKYML